MPVRHAARSSRVALPPQIPTARLVLRAWRTTDAPLLKRAIDDNLDHLRAWMPWARNEPSRLETIEQRIERFDRSWRADSEWSYAIFSEGEKMLYGGCGVQRAEEPGVVEIGFWLQKSWTGKGFATEAVTALTQAALAVPGVQRVQVRCDARNADSAAVARRAGFTHVASLPNHVFEPGAAPRETMVWEVSRPGATAPSSKPSATRGGALRVLGAILVVAAGLAAAYFLLVHPGRP